MRIPSAKNPSTTVTARFAARQTIGCRTIQRAKETMAARDYTEAPLQRARNRRRILTAQALDDLEEWRRVDRSATTTSAPASASARASYAPEATAKAKQPCAR